MNNTKHTQPTPPPGDTGLPEGWAMPKLGDICEHPQYGWTTSAQEEGDGLKLLRTSDISGQSLDWSSVPFCKQEPPDPNKYLLQKGDIVVSRAGSVGLSYLLGDCPPAVFASYLIRLRACPGLLPEFLRLYLLSPAYWADLADQTAGIAVQNINASKLRELEVPLPPFAEQKRIVAKVEALLERVNAARARLARLFAILKRFRQSVLAAACSGQLTAEWRHKSTAADTSDSMLKEIAAARQERFGSQKTRGGRHQGRGDQALPQAIDPSELSEAGFPAIPDGWSWVPCGDLCQPERALTYGVIKLGPAVDEGVPTLRSSDVRWLQIEEDHIKRISPRIAAKFSRTFIQGGEVLITVRGTLGGVAVTPTHMIGFNVSREVAVVPVEPPLEPWFIAFSVAADWSQNWLSGVTRGVAYTGVNIEDLRRLPLPVPPLSEQREIVRRVDALFALADGIEAHVRAATVRAERLPQSILARAFRGELVPTEAELAAKEGREYEPAPVLLERIQKAASHHEPQRKQFRTTTRKEAAMKKLDKASVLEVIEAMPQKSFAFDDLRAKLPGDYDGLKDILFALLDNPQSGVAQVFDKKAKAMRFRRRAKP